MITRVKSYLMYSQISIFSAFVQMVKGQCLVTTVITCIHQEYGVFVSCHKILDHLRLQIHRLRTVLSYVYKLENVGDLCSMCKSVNV